MPSRKGGRPPKEVDAWAFRFVRDKAILRLSAMRKDPANPGSDRRAAAALEETLSSLRGELERFARFRGRTVIHVDRITAEEGDAACLFGVLEEERGGGVRNLAQRLAARAVGISIRTARTRKELRTGRPLQPIDKSSMAWLPPLIERYPWQYARSLCDEKADNGQRQAMKQFARRWNVLMRRADTAKERTDALGEDSLVFFCEECAAELPADIRTCSDSCRRAINRRKAGR